MQVSPPTNRKTVSDLKLKKNLERALEDFKTNSNSDRNRQQKLAPIVGQITIKSIQPQKLISKEVFAVKNELYLQSQAKKLRAIEQISNNLGRNEARGSNQCSIELRKSQGLIFANNMRSQKAIEEKLESQIIVIDKKFKNTQKINTKAATLRKLQPQPKNSPQRKQRALLSPLDQNLKSIKALHYYMMEHQCQTPIIAYRSRTKIQVASLTKIMTFYTIYQLCHLHGINPKQTQLLISEEMSNISGTSAQLYPEQIYTIEQLLYGLMLPSGNDAAMGLAVWGGRLILGYALGDGQVHDQNEEISAFVERMNYEAGQLGMHDTKYANPHGLPHRDSRTTCQDIAILCSKCLHIPLFCEIVRTRLYRFRYYDCRLRRKIASQWQNTNKLLRRPGFIGIKTGITVTAGPCLATAYQFMGKTYITIIAKCSKPSRRFKETRKLLAHCLMRVNGEGLLSREAELVLKRLGQGDSELDSDYSQDEAQFDFGSFSIKEIRKRTRVLTQL